MRVAFDHRGEQPLFRSCSRGPSPLPGPRRHAADGKVSRPPLEITSDGAVAFEHWDDALVVTYADARGAHLGTSRVLTTRSARAFSDDED
jgi:hypothetical protein